MGCGDSSLLDGGTIKDASVINSQIVNSTIQASVLDTSSITNLTGVDEVSAKKIADAIAALPPDQLIPLINALVQRQIVTPASPPEISEASALPTNMYGNREIGMGAPDLWAKYGDDYIVPVFNKR